MKRARLTTKSHVYNVADKTAAFTISGTAKIYTNVANDSRLNADGGEIFGEVTNAVKNWSSAVIAGTEGAADSTEFKGRLPTIALSKRVNLQARL